MIHKEYSWSFDLYHVDANEVGAELEEIQETNELTPESVVEYAKDRRTTLNGLFEWNDEVAGHKWRLQQARKILNNITVEYVGKNDERKPIRAFVKTTTKKEEYRNIESVVSDAEQYSLLLNMAYRELNQTKNKYQTLSEIQELLKDIPEVL